MMCVELLRHGDLAATLRAITQDDSRAHVSRRVPATEEDADLFALERRFRRTDTVSSSCEPRQVVSAKSRLKGLHS